MPNTVSKDQKALMDKQRSETKDGFVYCELCGCKKTPKGSTTCVRCKGPIKAVAASAK